MSAKPSAELEAKKLAVLEARLAACEDGVLDSFACQSSPLARKPAATRFLRECSAPVVDSVSRLTTADVIALCDRWERKQPSDDAQVRLPGNGFAGLARVASGPRADFQLVRELEPETDAALALAAKRSGEKKVIDAIVDACWAPNGAHLVVARERKEGSSKRERAGSMPEQFLEVYSVAECESKEHAGIPRLTFVRRVCVQWEGSFGGKLFPDRNGQWWAVQTGLTTVRFFAWSELVDEAGVSGRGEAVLELEHECRDIDYSMDGMYLAIAQNDGFVDLYEAPDLWRRWLDSPSTLTTKDTRVVQLKAPGHCQKIAFPPVTTEQVAADLLLVAAVGGLFRANVDELTKRARRRRVELHTFEPEDQILGTGDNNDVSWTVAFSADGKLVGANLHASRNGQRKLEDSGIYLLETGTMEFVHVFAMGGRTMGGRVRGNFAFSPWPLAGGDPCIVYRQEINATQPEKKTLIKTVFVSLRTFAMVYSTSLSVNYRSFHPKQRLLLCNNNRIVCCDSRATAVAFKLEHDEDVQPPAVSPDVQRVAIVVKTSVGPRLAVMNVQTNTVLFAMKDFARVVARFVASHMLALTIGLDEQRFIKLCEEDNNPPQMMVVKCQDRNGPWGVRVSAHPLRHGGCVFQLHGGRHEHRLVLCSDALVQMLGSDVAKPQASEHAEIDEAVEDCSLINLKIPAPTFQCILHHFGQKVHDEEKLHEEKLLMAISFPGLVAIFDIEKLVYGDDSTVKTWEQLQRYKLPWEQEYIPKSPKQSDLNLSFTGDGTRLLVSNTASRNCRVLDLVPLLVPTENAQTKPTPREAHIFEETTQVRVSPPNVENCVRVLSRSDLEKQTDQGGKVEYLNADNGSPMWWPMGVAQWNGGAESGHAGGFLKGIDTKLDPITIVTKKNDTTATQQDSEVLEQTTYVVNVEVMRWWGLTSHLDAAAAIAGVTKAIQSQQPRRPDVQAHMFIQGQPHLLNLAPAHDGHTILHSAVNDEHIELVKLMLDSAVCVKVTSETLELACASPADDMATALFAALPKCSTAPQPDGGSPRAAFVNELPTLIKTHPRVAKSVLQTVGLESAVGNSSLMASQSALAKQSGSILRTSRNAWSITYTKAGSPWNDIADANSPGWKPKKATCSVVSFPDIAKNFDGLLEALTFDITFTLEIFDTPVVQLLLDHIWITQTRRLYIESIVLFALHLTSILLLSSEATSGIGTICFGIVALLTTLKLLSAEVAQLIQSGATQYLWDPWNHLQLAESGTLLPFLTIKFLEASGRDPADYANAARHFSAFAGFFAIVRTVSFMRASDRMGSLVRMITQVFMDLSSFAIVLVIIMLAFAWAFFILTEYSGAPPLPEAANRGSGFLQYLMQMFFILVGSYDEAEFSLHRTSSYHDAEFNNPAKTVLFFMYWVFVFLVMLNLVISIISDTYENVRESSKRNSLAQRAGLILELKRTRVRFVSKASNDADRWLHVIQPESSSSSNDVWQGQLASIKAQIDEQAAVALKESQALAASHDKQLTQMRKEHQVTLDKLHGRLEQQAQILEKQQEVLEQLVAKMNTN